MIKWCVRHKCPFPWEFKYYYVHFPYRSNPDHESCLHGILSSINSDQKAFYFSWLSKFCCSITIFFLTWTGADADVFIHVMIVRLFIGKYLCKLFALSIFFAIVAISNLLEFNFISAFQLPCCTAFVSTEWPLSLELPRELAEHPPIILCPIRFYPHFHLSGPSYTSCMLWYMVWKEVKLCESFLVLCVGVQHRNWNLSLKLLSPLPLPPLCLPLPSIPFHPLSRRAWPASTYLLSPSVFLFLYYSLNSHPHALNKLYYILKKKKKKEFSV